MMPIRCDTEWKQSVRAMVTGKMMLPPDQTDQIGKIVFRLTDLEGKTIGDFPAKVTTLHAAGNFQLAIAQWPNDTSAPGTFHVTGIVYGNDGSELARIAPRLVSAGWVQGY
jgi:hypothetical protein